MKIFSTILVTLFLIIIATKPAYAYLDPGTGSFILQVLAAGVLGSLFAVKTFWHSITSFFTNIFSRGRQVEKNPSAPVKRSNGKNK